MAVVGDQLLQPEDGWQRIDDRNSLIIKEHLTTGAYSGEQSGSGTYNNTFYQIYQGSFKFSFFGTKFRIISFLGSISYCKNVEVFLDNEKIGYYTNQSSTSNYPTQALVFEKIGLKNKIHNVELRNSDSSKVIQLDAIDIDEDGYLIASIGSKVDTPEEGLKRIINTSSLIKYNGYWEEETDSTLSSGRLRKTKDIYSNISFCFTGTKLRVISKTDYSNRSNEIGISIDGKEYTYTEKLTNGSNILTFQVLDLEDKNHKVIIYNKSRDSYLTFNAIDIDENGDLIADLNADYDFPIKIGSESNVERYSSSLINGEEQLLVTRKGSLYLTDGLGSFKQIGVSLDKFNELEKRVLALEEKNA